MSGELEVGAVAVRLGFKDDERGFENWQRRVVRAQQVKDINAHLGADVDQRGFETYYRKLDETKARVAKRDAFKAVLGADYDGRAFQAMERDIAKAERDLARVRVEAAKPIVAKLSADVDTRGFDQWGQRVDGSRREAARSVKAHLGADVDSKGFAAYNAALRKAQESASRRDAFKAALGPNFDATAFRAYEREAAKAGLITRVLQGRVGLLSGSAQELSKKTGLLPAALRLFTGAVQDADGAIGGGGGGLRGSLGAFSGAVGPALGALAAAIPIVVALGGAVTALAGSFAAAIAGAAAVGVGIAAALGPLVAIGAAVAQRVGLISAAYTALGAQQDNSAASATSNAQAQSAAAQQVKGAEQGLADAQRTVVRAQDSLTQARFRARREVQDLKTALDATNLSEQRANLSLEQAVAHLREVQADPQATSFDRRDAQLSVKEAQESLKEARIARDRAITDAKRGTDTVKVAEQQLADARRGAARAADQVAQAQTAAAAATAKQGAAASSAQTALGKLTSTERGLLATVRKTVDALQKTFQPATNAIFGSADRALKTLEPLIAPFTGRLKAIGESIGGVISGAAKALSGPEWIKALDAFVATAQKIVKPIGDTVGSVLIILRNIAVAAQPYVIEFAHWMQKALGGIADKTNDAKSLGNFIKGLVDQTKAWAHFAGAVAKLLLTIFGSGASQGKALVQTMTHLVDKFDKFLSKKKGQEELHKFFADSIDATKAIGKAFVALVPIVGGITEKFVQLIGWLGRNKTAVDLIVAALAGLFIAFGGPITVIGTFAAGLIYAYEKSKTFREVVNAVFQFVRKAIGEAVDGMLGNLTTLLGGLSSFLTFASKLPVVGGAFKAAAKGVDSARDSIDHLREGLRRATDPLGAFTQGAQDMRTKTYHSISGLRADVEKQMALIKSATLDGSDQAKQAMATNFQAAITAVKNSMAAGTLSVKNGLAEIDRLTRRLLKTYGFSDPSSALASLESPDALKPLPQTAPGLKPKRAQGGWIGAPGMVAHDSVALDAPVGGIVLNRHQLPVAQIALAASGLSLADLIGRSTGGPTTPIIAAHGEFLAGPDGAGVLDNALSDIGIGGLGELFGAISTPHYMAAGGSVVGASMYGGPGDPTTRKPEHGYHGDLLERNPFSYAELGNGRALGGLPYRHPLTIRYGSRSVTARKLDIGLGGADVNGHPRAIDLYYHLADALGFTGLGVVGINGAAAPGTPAGGAAPAAGGGPAASAARAVLRRVKVGGRGAISTLAQRAVDLARAGGQNLLDTARGAVGGLGGPGGAGGPAGLGTFDGLPVANWIVPELAYARAHGWPGHITSGYRDPRQVISGPVVAPQGESEHQGTQYPHGAVDFGGPSSPGALANKLAFLRATAAYKGRKLLSAIGFRDDGHMSGTGHSQGGVVSYAVGGRIRKRKATTSHLPSRGGTKLRIPSIEGAPVGIIGAHDVLQASIEDDRRTYEQIDRAYNQIDGPVVDPNTGEVNTDLVNQKVAVLDRLVEIRQSIHDKLQQLSDLVQTIIGSYVDMIGRLKKSLGHAKGKDRSTVEGELDQARGDLAKFQNEAHQLGFDITDSQLDINEITAERASIAGTQPDQGLIDSNAASAANAADAATAPPSPADIAAAAIADVGNFLSASQQQLSAYASNFITPFQAAGPGGVFSGAPDQLSALGGAGFIGAGGDGSLGGPAGRSVTIVNHYNQLPDNTQTWSSQQRFQIEAAVG